MSPFDEELAKAIGNQQATAISALNGVVSVLIFLAKRKLITQEELSATYDSMSKPFTPPHLSDNSMAQDSQRRLDELFGEVRRYMKEGPLPPDRD